MNFITEKGSSATLLLVLSQALNNVYLVKQTDRGEEQNKNVSET
jgi:hypothetical protein